MDALKKDMVEFVSEEINWQGIEDDLSEKDAFDWGPENSAQFMVILKRKIKEAIEASVVEYVTNNP